MCYVSVSEMSDENMMDASNLAIIFGPTLMPVPSDRDLVFCQVYVNELMKNIIIHYESVFPFDGGVVYERFIVDDEGYLPVCCELACLLYDSNRHIFTQI